MKPKNWDVPYLFGKIQVLTAPVTWAWNYVCVLPQNYMPLYVVIRCALGDINFFEVNGRGPKLTLGLGELNPEV